MIKDDIVDMPMVVSLYGEVEEDKCEEVIKELYTVLEVCKNINLQEEILEEKLDVGIDRQVHMIISTYGGSAHDMFAVYDCLRALKCLFQLLNNEFFGKTPNSHSLRNLLAQSWSIFEN